MFLCMANYSHGWLPSHWDRDVKATDHSFYIIACFCEAYFLILVGHEDTANLRSTVGTRDVPMLL
jgi:hypothetical protein